MHTSEMHVAQYVRKSTTEHQRYSIENQMAANEVYAAARHFNIVRTYSDAGRSGLKIENREALKQLISDVQAGNVPYRAILVYDVSRWGRFQDADESAYYEYACKRAGISVHYCAEQFDNDGTPLSTIIKGIKRAMAGEYSRELGVKVFAGQKNIVQKGFRIGSYAGYGLRRMLVDPSGKRKHLLKVGERKSITSDRTILVHGPAKEVKIVRWIFKTYISGKMRESAMARALNRRKIPNGCGTLWCFSMVNRILTNPKYMGANVWNRSTQRLGNGYRVNQPSEWVRSSVGFDPIVTARTFDRARQARIEHRKRVPDEAILDAIRKLWKKRGKLTLRMIDEENGLVSSGAMTWRFGSISAVYRLIGYHKPRVGPTTIEMNQHLQGVRTETVGRVQKLLEVRGDVAEPRAAGRNAALLVNNETMLYFLLTRSQPTWSGKPCWCIRLDMNAGDGAAVVTRMDQDNKEVEAYYFFPSNDLIRVRRKLTRNGLATIEPYRIKNLSALYALI